MERNDGTPTSYGRGRPSGTREMRRPLQYPTYAAEFVPAEGIEHSAIYPPNLWSTDSRGNKYGPCQFIPSPSGDHLRHTMVQGVPVDGNSPMEKNTFHSTLSPYAKEFVPRNFQPDQPRIPSSEIPDDPVDSISDTYPVQELRSFLNEITLSPGKFERKIQPLIDTLNARVDDDDTMRAIVNIIFDESVRQANLRYSGARLCKQLCNDLDPSADRINFRSVLLNRCNQEFRRREDLAQAEDGGAYLRGFAMFLAELFSQLEISKHRVGVLGDNLPSLIKTIASHPTTENIKCVCQIMKLVGAFLEEYERGKCIGRGAPEMEGLIGKLSELAGSADVTRNMRDMIGSVIKLQENKWGQHTESNSGSELPPSTPLDEPVMYGPDGKPMTHDELMFLQSQYASNMPPDDYDLYDDNTGDEMPEEISEAYEVFLRDHMIRP